LENFMTRQRKVPYLLALGVGLAILWGVAGLPALAEDAPAAPAAAAAPAAPDPIGTPAKADSTGTSYTGGSSSSAALTKDKDKVTLETLARDTKNLRMALNIFWTLVTGFLVMFMQTGFAMLETGLCRSKNAAHTMAMNFGIYAIGLLGFWICGFALMAGGWGPVASMDGPNILDKMFSIGKWDLLGHKGFFLTHEANDATVLTLFLFQMVFMDTAATIPTGAMAERWKFSAFCVYGFFMSMFLYPVFGCWVWGGGWLADLGTNFGLGHGHVDFAGSSVVHMTGGVCALAGAMVLGPRIGKFNRDGSPNAIAAHNIPMAAVGTLILAFGWFGFNPGSSLAATDLRIGAIAVNTMLASGAGCFTALLYMWAVYGKPDPTMGCNGLLAGLVAITAPCAFVNPVGAVIIGTVSGILVVWGVLFVERVLKVDDPVGAVAVHGVNGAWGCLSIGLLATGEYGDNWNSVPGTVTGLFYGGGFSQLAAEVIGVTTNFVWVFGLSFIFFKILDKTMGMRVSAKTEIEGLDIHEMGVPGYVNEDTMAVQVAGQEHLSIFGPGVPKKKITEKEVVGAR
jgi:Amt family ammonium transporter